MVQTIKNDGNNKYKVPHMNMGKIARRGMLLNLYTCPKEVVQYGKLLLNGQNQHT